MQRSIRGAVSFWVWTRSVCVLFEQPFTELLSDQILDHSVPEKQSRRGKLQQRSTSITPFIVGHPVVYDQAEMGTIDY